MTIYGATPNEIVALQCCINPNSSVENMLDDAAQVCGGLPEFMEALGWNKKQVAALIGSMEEKGYGVSDENENNGHIFWPSRLGYEIAFEALAKKTA